MQYCLLGAATGMEGVHGGDALQHVAYTYAAWRPSAVARTFWARRHLAIPLLQRTTVVILAWMGLGVVRCPPPSV